MLRGLLEKGLHETWRVSLLTSLGLALVMGLFVQVLPQFEEVLNELILGVPFIRTLISGLVGMDISAGIAPRMLLVVAWSHPIVLAIVWGLGVVLATRVPATEIERGTIDVLLGWPVSRRAIYLGETILWLVCGALVLFLGWTGFGISASTLPAELRPSSGSTLLSLLNLFALYVAVSASAQCICAACGRRGQAMGLALAYLLASYLLQFLSTLWEPAERIAAVSFAHYYQPGQVMLTGEAPCGDIAVLLVWGAVTWAIGLAIWERRSVLTT